MGTLHFKTLRILMIICGLWKVKLTGTAALYQKFYNIYSIFPQLYFVLVAMAELADFPILWKKGEMLQAMANIEIVIVCVIVIMQMLITQRKEVVKFVEDLLEDEMQYQTSPNEDEIRIYKRNAEIINKLSLFMVLYALILVYVPLIIVPYFIDLNLRNLHQFDNVTYDRPLPYQTWFPFDPNKKYYALAYGIHVTSGMYGCSINVTTYFFFVTLITFIITKLKILKNHFRKYHLSLDGEHKDENDIIQNLKKLIAEHQNVNDYVQRLDDLTKTLMLLAFSINTIQIAAAIVVVLMIPPGLASIFTVSFFGNVILQIFVLAWQANEIKEQSHELSTALYESNWYEHSVVVRKYILIMMIRCERPLMLNIGPFYPMTTATAVSTLKAGYSYVALFRAGIASRT